VSDDDPMIVKLRVRPLPERLRYLARVLLDPAPYTLKAASEAVAVSLEMTADKLEQEEGMTA
jgi:hypothetical protein